MGFLSVGFLPSWFVSQRLKACWGDASWGDLCIVDMARMNSAVVRNRHEHTHYRVRTDACNVGLLMNVSPGGVVEQHRVVSLDIFPIEVAMLHSQ